MTIVLVIIGLSLLILAHEFGHFIAAKVFKLRVDEFGIGFPPRVWGKRIGETLYSINALPFGGFVKIFGENEIASEEKTFASRNFSSLVIWRRIVIICAGVVVNFLAGWFLISIVLMAGVPQHLLVTDVLPDSPAKAAFIEAGDVVLSVTTNVIELSDPIESEEFIAAVRDPQAGTVHMTLARGAERVSVSLTPRANPAPEEGAIGAGVVSLGKEAQPFFSSITQGAVEAGYTTWFIAASFVALFSQIFVRPEIIQSIAGPVGIVSLATQASSLGFVYFLQLLAIISLNLTVLNLIPFPALDGGRAIFLIIEKIKGSSISANIQRNINAVGFVLLILLMIVVTVQDVGKLFR